MNKVYPDWVEKQHTKGTTIRRVGENYYLYSSTSKYDKVKKRPVAIQKYIGVITPEGLKKRPTISFQPGVDSIKLIKDVFSVDKIKAKDLSEIENIPVVVVDGKYYIGKLSAKQITTMQKYFKLEEGCISE